MIGLLAVGCIASLVGLVVLTVDNVRDRTRKVRRREFESAVASLNTIDSIVDTSYMSTDLVGQAICDEIRKVIHQHRKDTTAR